MASPAPPMDSSSSLYSDSSIPLVMGTTTSLLVLALITYGLRIYSRVYPYRTLGIDDHTMTLAMIFSIVDWGLTVATQVQTKGKRMTFIDKNDLTLAVKYSFISMPIWVWAVAFIKISVCFMLLRIKTSLHWRIGVGMLIFINFGAATAATVLQLLQCAPVAANWDPTLGKCWETKKVQTNIYSCTSIFIITDFACAVLPLAFIVKVNRPLRERLVLTMTMGLGIIAGSCGIAKLVLISKMTQSSDPIWQNATMAVYAYDEQFLGIIAACIPCLKALLEKAFHKLGGRLTSYKTTRQTGMSSSTKRPSVQLDTLASRRSMFASKQDVYVQSETASSNSDEVGLCNNVSTVCAPQDLGKCASPYIVKETTVEWKSSD